MTRHVSFSTLGPGLLGAATGAGDRITASLAGSEVGLIVAAAALVGAVLKWTLNERRIGSVLGPVRHGIFLLVFWAVFLTILAVWQRALYLFADWAVVQGRAARDGDARWRPAYF